MRSHLLTIAEIRGLYVRQALWLSVTIVFGLLCWYAYFDSVPARLTACYDDPSCLADADLYFTSRNGLKWTLVVAVCAEAAILIGYLHVAGASERFAAQVRASVKPLPPGLQAKLQPFVDELKTGLAPGTNVEVGVHPNVLHWAPSVIEDKRSALLIVPVGFFGLLNQDPSAAKAILAHEFCHIRYRDSWVFATQSANRIAYRWIVLPSLIAVLVVSIVGMSPVSLSLWALIGVFTSARKVKRSLRDARHASEQRADIYACVYGDRDGLLRVLRTCERNDKRSQSDKHPDPGERISSITSSGVRIEPATSKSEVPATAANLDPWAISRTAAEPPRKKPNRQRRWRPGQH
jgi:hypothetical protein